MSAMNRTRTIALSESTTTALRQRAISPPTTHDQTKSPHRTKARRRRPRQGLPFHCAHRRRGSVSTATARCPMSAPHDFWTVLQKMGPDFAMSLGFWAVSRECGTIQGSPTWGNADAPRPSKPKPPAKPPRSRGCGRRAWAASRGSGRRRQQAAGAGSCPKLFLVSHLRAVLARATVFSTRGSRDPPPGR